MLDTERQFFHEKREDFLRKFPGKFVVVKDRQVLGAYESIEEALGAGARVYGVTSVLVRRTEKQPEHVSIPALTLGLLPGDPHLCLSQK